MFDISLPQPRGSYFFSLWIVHLLALTSFIVHKRTSGLFFPSYPPSIVVPLLSFLHSTSFILLYAF